MNRRFLQGIASLATIAMGLGCQTSHRGDDADRAAAVVKQPAAVDNAEPPSRVSADGKSPSCPGEITTGTPQKVVIAGVSWELAGSTLAQKSPLKTTSLTIGAVSDIKEATPENIENLRRFAAWFREKKVDVVVVAGDTGETPSQIESSLAILAALDVPVFAIIGNREGVGVYDEALRTVRAKYQNVFDLNRVRRVDTTVADFISQPGYHNATYLHADDGCHYSAQQAEQLRQLARASNSPVVLLSHGGPRQTGALAIDRTAEGENAGDPAMAKIVAEEQIPFGIFGNIHEAGGHAADLAGAKRLPQGTPLSQMYLNVGPADSVRWVMNDGSESRGMAAAVTVTADGKASYEVLRIPGGKLARRVDADRDRQAARRPTK